MWKSFCSWVAKASLWAWLRLISQQDPGSDTVELASAAERGEHEHNKALALLDELIEAL